MMRRRTSGLAIGSVAAIAVAIAGCSSMPTTTLPQRDATVTAGATDSAAVPVSSPPEAPEQSAADALKGLPVKGRAPKTGYSRSAFGEAWTDDNGVLWGGNSLSTREDILSRDLIDIRCKTRESKSSVPPCVVQTGTLHDPYSGITVDFVRGSNTSPLVPIDHVVSLSDAWQKGAQQLSPAERVNLANDPLNLIATTQEANATKSDSDAASWLVPNRSFRCEYVARQVAVKARYRLWVTQAENDAIARVLEQCPGQKLPSAPYHA